MSKKHDFGGMTIDASESIKTNWGGPAFPRNILDHGHGVKTVHESGMTLRDYFAAKALSGLIGLWTENSRHLRAGQTLDDFVAEQAYLYADAMLQARET